MDQPELELQLKAWKELAISKQVLIRAATDALGLDSECSSNELKVALDTATQRALSADANIDKAREKAKQAITAMEEKVAQSEQAKRVAEKSRDEALASLKDAEHRIDAGRAANAKELQKMTTQLAERQKALKAINVALADTPENVLKKLKNLKKEKLDESNARKRVEADVRALRKDKQQLEQREKELKPILEKTTELVEKHRELQVLCTDLHQQLEALVEDKDSLPELPGIDEEMLSSIEQALRSDEKEK